MSKEVYHSKDRSGKNLLAIPEILADLINNDLYDGNQYVLAENVFFIDSVLTEVKSEDGEVTDTEERIRDVRAIVIAKEPGGYVPFVFGVEPQTSQDPCMPVRNGNYDFMSMMKQLKEGRKVPLDKEEWKKLKEGEHLGYIVSHRTSLCSKSIALNFSDTPWTKPMDVHSVYEGCVPSFATEADNYVMMLSDPMKMSDEFIRRYRTAYRILAGCWKYHNDKEKMIRFLEENRDVDLDERHVALINAITKAGIEVPQKGEVIKVCRAFDEIYQDYRNEGIDEGIVIGRTDECIELYLEGDVTRERALKRTGLTEEEFDRKAAEIRKRMLS